MIVRVHGDVKASIPDETTTRPGDHTVASARNDRDGSLPRVGAKGRRSAAEH